MRALVLLLLVCACTPQSDEDSGVSHSESDPTESEIAHCDPIDPPLADFDPREDGLLPTASVEAVDKTVRYAIVISVDGLRGDLLQDSLSELPGFRRLATEGAWTCNARTDATYTVTLPNHTSMITGLPVESAEGLDEEFHHGWTNNGSVGDETTLHNGGNEALDYIPSIFDVAHDNGLRTGVFVSKSKFEVWDQSYNEVSGAKDQVGRDDGEDKIDVYTYTTDQEALTNALLTEMQIAPMQLSFLHFREPDSAGHSSGWDSEDWYAAVRGVDGQIARILAMVDTTEPFRGRTYVLLTADHGGDGNGHSMPDQSPNYVVPFFVWGPGVSPGEDLYALTQRVDPGIAHIGTVADNQPIRNGHIGNFALHLLGLDPVPGSLWNDLRLRQR